MQIPYGKRSTSIFHAYDPCTGAWVTQDPLPFRMQVAYAASVGPVITAVSTASGAFVGAFSTVT